MIRKALKSLVALFTVISVFSTATFGVIANANGLNSANNLSNLAKAEGGYALGFKPLEYSITVGNEKKTDLPKKVVAGQLTGDTDADELTTMISALLGKIECDDSFFDGNNDGEFNLLDLVALKKHLAGEYDEYSHIKSVSVVYKNPDTNEVVDSVKIYTNTVTLPELPTDYNAWIIGGNYYKAGDTYTFSDYAAERHIYCSKFDSKLDVEFSLEKFGEAVPNTATEVYFGTKAEYLNEVAGLSSVAIDAGESDNIKAYEDGTVYYVVNETNGNIVAPQFLNEMFCYYEDVETIIFGEAFDTSNVTVTDAMLYGCSSLTCLDVSHFDTSKVTDFLYMFGECTALSSIDVSNFNTASAVDMQGMFNCCYSLENLDLSGFDMSGVTNISFMFSYCTSLVSVNFDGVVAENLTEMSGIFYECNSLTNLDISGFDTSNVTDMSYIFALCTSLKSLNVSNFVTDKATTMYAMFYSCPLLTAIDVSAFNTSNSKSFGYMFGKCSGLSTIDVTGFDTSNATQLSGMFYECTGLTVLNLSSFDTSATDICDYMFYGCTSLVTVYASDKFVTDNIESSIDMFENCTSLVGDNGTVYDPENIDKAYAKCDDGESDKGYFSHTIDAEFNLEEFKTAVPDTATEIYFGSRGKYAKKIAGLSYVAIDEDETEHIRVYADGTVYYVVNEMGGKIIAPSSLEKMFRQYGAVTTIVFSDLFDTSNVTSMMAMFYGCGSLKELDLSDFNTSNVTSMCGMFYECFSLTKVDVSSFDTSCVTDMSYIFSFCTSLPSVDVSNFVTDKVQNMYGMFYSCPKMTEIDVSGFDTSEATFISHMFGKCTSLKGIDVSNFNTEKAVDIAGFIAECVEIEFVDLTSFDTANVEEIDYMFDGCTNLKTIYVSDKFVTDNVRVSDDMFKNCTSLVGENGTAFDPENIDVAYAKFDGGESDKGYFSHVVNAEFNLEKFKTAVPYTATEIYFGTKAEYQNKISGLTYVAIDEGETDYIRVYADGTVYYVVNELCGKITAPKSVSKMFYGYENVKVVLFGEKFDISNVTNIDFLFGIDEETHEHEFELVSNTATCSATGTATYSCSCGRTFTVKSPAGSHDFKLSDFKNATCTEDGFVHYVCANCNAEKTEALPKFGHNYQLVGTVSVTCEENGYDLYLCSRCNEIEHRNEVSALGHIFTFPDGDYVTLVACEREGCEACGRRNSENTYIEVFTYSFNDERQSEIDELCDDAELAIGELAEYNPLTDGYVEGSEKAIAAEAFRQKYCVPLDDILDEMYAHSSACYLRYNIVDGADGWDEKYEKMLASEDSYKVRYYTLMKKIYDSEYREYVFTKANGWIQSTIDQMLRKANAMSSENFLELSARANEIQIESRKEGADIATLYIEFVDVKNQFAKLFGYDNYMDYAYADYYYRDYAPEDTATMRNFVKQYLSGSTWFETNLAYNIEASNLGAMEQAWLDLFNETSPLYDEDACLVLIQYCQYLSKIAEERGVDFYTELNDSFKDGLVFTGEYQAAYSDYLEGEDLSLMYFGPDYSSLFTFIHEFGHYMSFVSLKDTDIGYDFAETHSQGNEMLFLAYIGARLLQMGFEDVYNALLLTNLSDAFAIISLATCVDEFEQIVYTNEYDGDNEVAIEILSDGEIEADELQDLFTALLGEYESSGFINPEYWSYVVIHSPGYYISYAMSLISSLSIYIDSANDLNAGAEEFIKLFDFADNEELYVPEANIVAGTYTEILEYAGIRGPFDESIYQDLRELIINSVSSYRAIINQYLAFYDITSTLVTAE